MKRTIIVCLTILAVLAMAGAAAATVPRLMSFQGKLTNNADQPLTGNHNFTFKIYGAESGGVALWTEIQNTVAVETGIYNVLLGSVTPLNLAFDTGYWMSVNVNGDGEMTPRYRLTSAPYSLYSDTATNVVSGGSGGAAQRIVISGTFDTSVAGDYISGGRAHYKLINDARIVLSDMPQWTFAVSNRQNHGSSRLLDADGLTPANVVPAVLIGKVSATLCLSASG